MKKKFLVNLFHDNGHKRATFETLANNYTPPTIQTQKNNSKKQKPSTTRHDETPENLFDVLPFRDVPLEDETEYKPYACLTYLPGPTHHRLKRAFSKAGVNMVTRSGTKLKDLLCSANTTKHDPVKKPGIYEIQCPCSESSKYVGQTARSIITRGKEHGSAANRGNWSHSGISAHKEFCKDEIDWTTPKVIATKTNKNKKRLNYDLKVREALEIRRRGCGPGQGLNEDFGAYVKTTMWNPVFHQMDRD